ncbi:MAG: hypothetical protein IJU95_10390 [Treponema sp.]|nr:hypothetical protein [Treponema sp.]
MIYLTGLFAQNLQDIEQSCFYKDGMEMFAEGTAVVNTGQGWETYYFAVQPYFQLDTTKVTAYTGMQITKGTFDLTLGAAFFPWVWDKMRVGFSARYNLDYYNDTSLSHNFLPGANLEVRPTSWFALKGSVSCMFKSRSIFAIDSSNKYLHSICQAFSIETDFYLPYEIMAYFSVASYERYRYMTAVAPTFTLGATKQFAKNFHAGLEAAVRYTDFFTTSTFYDGCEIRLSVGRKF